MAFGSAIKLACILGLFCCLEANETMAELSQKIEKAQGVQRAGLLLELSDVYRTADPPKAIPPAVEALSLYEMLRDSKGQVWALLRIGRAKQALADFPGAISSLERGSELAERIGEDSGRARCLLELSVVHQRLGNHSVSMSLAYQSLTLEERLGKPERVAACLNIIGGDHFRQGQYARAKEAWERSLSIYQSTQNQAGQANLLNNLGALATTQNDYQGALSHLEQGLDLRIKLNDRLGQAEFFNNLAEVLLKQGKLDLAEQKFRQSFDLKKEAGDAFGMVVTGCNLAELLGKRKRWSEAHSWLSDARQRAEMIHSNHLLAECYVQEAALAESEGNPSTALNWQRKVLAAKEAVFSEEVAKKVAEAGVLHEVDKQRHTIEILKRDQALQKSRIRQYILATVGLVILVLVTHNRYRLKVKSEQQLQTQNRELERLNQLKTEFLGIVAHDLRNPLTGMVLIADAMQGESDLNQLWAEAGVLKEQGMSLNRLLGRYLKVSAIESGKLEVQAEVFPLRELLNEKVYQWEKSALKKEIKLVPFEGVNQAWVLADAGCIRQVLDNLISNAVKFSPLGGEVRFGLNAMDDEQVLTVADHGPGLSEEDRQRIFDRFARLSAQPTGGEASTGLGLSIVKHMVEACGGRVWVEETPGGGASFRIALPAAQPL